MTFEKICGTTFLLTFIFFFTNDMNWAILILAGLFEVAFTTCLKLSENFSNWKWSAGFFISIFMSFFLLNKATQTIPLGTGYAVWTGIGAVGTVIIGILFFREPSDFWRVFFIALLIGSILGLKLVSSH
jgi:quaternary ammonium compound-resistance protein SugE